MINSDSGILFINIGMYHDLLMIQDDDSKHFHIITNEILYYKMNSQ